MALAITHVDRFFSVTNAGLYTFTGRQLGAAPAAGQRRFIVFGFHCERSSDLLAGMESGYPTVGGIVLTHINDVVGGGVNNRALGGIYYGEVQAGTIGDVVIDVNGTMENFSGSLWRILSDINGIVLIDSFAALVGNGPGTRNQNIDLVVGGCQCAYHFYSKDSVTVAKLHTGAQRNNSVAATNYVNSVVTANTPNAAWTDLSEAFDEQIESGVVGVATTYVGASFGMVAGGAARSKYVGQEGWH